MKFKLKRLLSLTLMASLLVNLTGGLTAEANVDYRPNITYIENNGNSLTVQWAVEMPPENVIYETSFEEGQFIPSFSGAGNGGQTLTSETKASGLRSIKINDTINNSNHWLFPATSGDWSIMWFTRQYFDNGTNLSLNYKMKSDTGGIIRGIGDGGWANSIHTIQPKVIGNAPPGTTLLFLNSLSDITLGSYITDDTDQVNIRNVYQIIKINTSNNSVKLSSGLVKGFSNGESLRRRDWRGAFGFPHRNAPPNSDWTTYSANCKVADFPDYNVKIRGGSFYFYSFTGGNLYLDDVQFGYATATNLYRQNTNGTWTKLPSNEYLTEYVDTEAKDTAKPLLPSVTPNYTTDTIAVNATDTGTTYTYKVHSKPINGSELVGVQKSGTATSGVKGYIVRNTDTPTADWNDMATGSVALSKITHNSTGALNLKISDYQKRYLHIMSVDAAGNYSWPVRTIELDYAAPNISGMNVSYSDVTEDSLKYTISNVNDEAGVKNNGVSYKATGITETQNQGLTATINNLTPNKKYNLQYKLADIRNNITDWSREYPITTMALAPKTGEVRDYDGITAKIKFKLEEWNGTVVNQKYQFQLRPVGGGSSIDSGVLYGGDTLATFTGLTDGKNYEVWGKGINDDNIPTEWNRIVDTNGNPLSMDAKANMTVSVKSGKLDWITTTTPEQRIILDIVDGDSIREPLELMLDGVKYSDNKPIQQNTNTVDLRLTAGSTFSMSREVEGSTLVIRAILPNLKQGKNKLGIVGLTGELELGYDTEGPTIQEGAIKATALDSSQQLLIFDQSKLTDVSTLLGAMKISVNGAPETGLTSAMTVPTPASNFNLKVYDRFGQFSTFTLPKSTLPSIPSTTDGGNVGTGGTVGGTGSDSGTASNPIETTSPIVTVPIPAGGTHFRTSLDGVTWSEWQERGSLTEAKITLPTGDGEKTTYVQTGEGVSKTKPIYVNGQGVVNVETQDKKIIPLNNTVTTNFISDLTAPKITIRTQDNSLIAKGGSIGFLVDVIDALDKRPRVKVKLSTIGVTKSGSAIAPIEKSGTMVEGKTQLEFPITGLTETYKNGKLTFYTLEVIAWDSSGNRSVEFINFYVKN